MAATLYTRHVRLTKARAFYIALQTSIRQQSSSAAGSSSRQQTKARDQRRRSKTNLDQVDLVGPPDAISNIRPMFYAPVPSYSQSPSSSTSHTSQRLPHPYSLSEFSQTSKRAGKQTSRAGLGVFSSYRDHIDRISNQVEEAEMKLRVSKLGVDNVTQRFWRDNNTRFTRDLESWREESHRRFAALPETVRNEQEPTSQSQKPNVALAERALEAANELTKDESAFYANWLRANGRRNRAYNVLVWKQTWEQVRLGARVTLLRNWLAALIWMRGR